MPTALPQASIADRRIESFSAKNTGSYNINQRCYPLEISTDVDKQHYVTFYINVRGKSKFMKTNSNKIIGEIASGQENRVDSRQLGVSGGAGIGFGAGTVATLGAGRTVMQAKYANSISKGGSVKGSAIKGAVAGGVTVLAGGLTGAAVGAAVGEFIVRPDTAYRISDAITMHISAAPSAQYKAQYDNVELGSMIGGIATGISASDATRAAMVPEAARAVMLKAAGGLGNLVSAGAVGNAIGVGSKQNLNPFREVLFQASGFRQFTFDYVFMPRSEQENKNVHEIIKTFKYHMHPELSEGGLYFIHPSEFNIQYYYNGKENKFFNKISTCVLEDCQVDYGGEAFSSFHDGSPVEIKMRLVFQEIETLTKDRILEGF